MKVIFLDIDGVLQPSVQHRFDYDLDALKVRLAKEWNNDFFLEVDKYDAGAVFYDWWLPAVRYLRILCEEFSAHIVISSAWRVARTFKELQTVFDIHHLAKYVVGMTPLLSYPNDRATEILQYMEAHPEITEFVVIDDAHSTGHKREFPNRFVHTKTRLNRQYFQQALHILTGIEELYYQKRAKKIVFLNLESLFDEVPKKTWFAYSPEAYMEAMSNRNKALKTLKADDLWKTQYQWSYSAAEGLVYLCERYEAAIVIPHSWSKGYTIEQMKLLYEQADLSSDIAHYVIDIIEPKEGGTVAEIEAWLAENPHIEEYIICEDQEDTPLYDAFPNRTFKWKKNRKKREENREEYEKQQENKTSVFFQVMRVLASGESLEEDYDNRPGFYSRHDL